MKKSRLLHVVATRMFTTLAADHTIEWLERRLDIFETFTLPSLTSQSCQDFTWILLVSADLPLVIFSKLKTMVKPYANIYILAVRVADLHDQAEYQEVFSDFIQQHKFKYDFLLSSRIDGDDAWHKNYVAKIQQEALAWSAKYTKWSNSAGVIFNFPYGQICYPFEIRGKEGIGNWRRKFFSQSVDVLSVKKLHETLYKFPHSKTAQFAKANNYLCHYIKTKHPMWLYVQHVQNDGLLRKWHRWFILFEKFMLKFHHFKDGELEEYGISEQSRQRFKQRYLAHTRKC